MDAHWTTENVEESARKELGDDLRVVVDLFPRVANAIYVQMHNGDLHDSTEFTRAEFRRRVLGELPRSCEEVTPFLVRTVWNRKWHPATHAQEIAQLIALYAQAVRCAGGTVTEEELMAACQHSFA